jgi:MFS family permease
VKNERRLFGIVELVTAYSILGTPFLALMPVVAREMLGLGAAGCGVLLSAVGIGGLTGALTLAAVGSRAGRGTLLTVATYVLPIVLLVLSVTRLPAIAYGVVTLAGFTMIVHGAVANGLLQTLVPDEFRGRLMSIYSLIVVGLPQVVGAFAAGVVARLIGIDWAIGGGAAVMLIIGWTILRRYPELRRL